MGDPKFQRRLYDSPTHPWKADRILEESGVERKFGLKNKREVWKAKSKLRGFRAQARTLLARSRTGEDQAKLETSRLIRRLYTLGLLDQSASLDDVLGIDLDRLLRRRLQTQVWVKGLASSPKQARQFIAHGHVAVKGVRVRSPGHIVRRDQEDSIELPETSAVADPEHPVRAQVSQAEASAKHALAQPAVPPEPTGPGGRRGGGRRR